MGSVPCPGVLGEKLPDRLLPSRKFDNMGQLSRMVFAVGVRLYVELVSA